MTNQASAAARSTYNIEGWSEGYFDVDDGGELAAYPDKDRQRPGIRLSDVVNRCQQQGLTLPILVRFTDILQSRVDHLVAAFDHAKIERRYEGRYTAVYPIKVNQQYSVIRKLIDHRSGQVGLEAGSKPELMAVLGIAEQPIKIVCNGYKDSEFLRLATFGQMMGHQVFVVIEKISELRALLREIDDLGAAPYIGIRIRLNSVGKGKWQNTGGEKGKFGLTAGQVLQAVDMLVEAGRLDLLRLVHFHIGSQIANIRDIHNAIRECARHYAELRLLGAPVSSVDVGGGLGVDYEGSGSRSGCSMNYSLDEYARNVVSGLDDICHELSLPHPDIFTESGRAMTAHHAVLITDVIDTERAPGRNWIGAPDRDAHGVLRSICSNCESITTRNAVETYHDAIHCFADAYGQYVNGLLGMREWAEVETAYFATLRRVRELLDPHSRSHHEILDELNEKLADKMFVNFSLFQSLPDAWGIDQIFPVLPLTRLDEALTDRAIIQDITCDSDGQVKQYANSNGLESSMPLPAYRDGENYLIGMFMVGAYQEILGDMHNLFGDTDSVHVELDGDGDYRLVNLLKGDTVSDVLGYVHFDPAKALDNYRRRLAATNLDASQQQRLLEELQAGLNGYTYFEG